MRSIMRTLRSGRRRRLLLRCRYPFKLFPPSAQAFIGHFPDHFVPRHKLDLRTQI
jgi:hypothetical protein